MDGQPKAENPVFVIFEFLQRESRRIHDVFAGRDKTISDEALHFVFCLVRIALNDLLQRKGDAVNRHVFFIHALKGMRGKGVCGRARNTAQRLYATNQRAAKRNKLHALT